MQFSLPKTSHNKVLGVVDAGVFNTPGSLWARNWFKKNDEFDLKWIGGMKIGPKVYGKQESVKSQDFPPGGKIGSKMAPVNKIFLKVPEIKN